ncbi:fused ATPase and permease components of ABC transport system [Amycolatopsis mediterranei S699]|uniref:Fused ATPase and permease components of ABC transport system n=2 Tax=Amycolatopsis mediterranei TaxID=33910 RepID=A0A0H3CY66_AMYMU|nr:fused ATPase and permease components of ABC transport system [Amycolatopsis mediterranei U32]AEK39562.1 fused ATPase and permease components of ABC transport system [Amycolatopsis mediterranei S699]AGT81712.1 fused ATPase and permease components of ABC transport system [Amycolatopsis mediterranei RB]KDO10126.1 ABC transporter ATPase [Amycolatopsis mediterranei]AFO74583.1 fused ATPase and permease components of ABC transport system [Amycolatopsis mediterranei S699]
MLSLLGVLTAFSVLLQAEGLATLLTGGGVSLPLLVAIAARAGLSWGHGVLSGRFAVSVRDALRQRLLRSASDRAGVVATQVTRGVDATDSYLTGYLPSLVVSVVVPAAVIVRLFTADLVSALVVVVTLPLIPVFAVLVGKQAKASVQWELLTKLGGHFLDVVRGLGTLKVFGRAAAQAATVRSMASAHADATMKTLRVAFLSALVLELVATLSVALVAVPIGFRLLSGDLDARSALLILVLTPEAYLPLRAAGAKFHAAAEGLTALREALSAPVVSPRSAVSARRRGAPSLVLERVSVSYEGVPALSEVDLAVPAGSRIAVVGPSGSGKSTLLAVLLGFVPPSSGRVLVDGVDLRSLAPAAWLEDVAWVPQRPTLFRGSLASNIALGLPSADVPFAARAAALDSLAAGLPQGFETPVGEVVSAGQRQRIGLARALARTSAGLVLLDEPTARLDSRTEDAVLSATRRLLPGRTAVLVAHRPAMVSLADRVIELRGGRVRPEVAA